MTDVSTLDRPAPTPAKIVAVTATELGAHLGITRQRIGDMVTERIIERLPSGKYDQDACRLRYLNWLRDPARRSARSEAASAFTDAKTRLIEIRIREKEGSLVDLEEALSFVDDLVGTFRTKCSGLAAECSRDLPTRRKIDAAVDRMLNEIADMAERRAQETDPANKKPEPETEEIDDADE